MIDENGIDPNAIDRSDALPANHVVSYLVEHIECREGWVLKGEKCVNPETSDVNNGEPVENAGPLVVFYGALIFMVGCVFVFVKPEKTSGPQTPLLHPVVR